MFTAWFLTQPGRKRQTTLPTSPIRHPMIALVTYVRHGDQRPFKMSLRAVVGTLAKAPRAHHAAAAIATAAIGKAWPVTASLLTRVEIIFASMALIARSPMVNSMKALCSSVSGGDTS